MRRPVTSFAGVLCAVVIVVFHAAPSFAQHPVSLTFRPSQWYAGDTAAVNGTVTLSAPAGLGGLTVELTKLTRDPLMIPASVTFPAGSSSVTFQAVPAVVQSGSITSTVRATTANAKGYADGSLTTHANYVQSVTVAPVATAGESVPVTVTVRNNAPAGGTSVNLGFVATLGTIAPNPLVIPQGVNSGTATLVLKNVGGNASTKITATNGSTPVEGPLQIKGNQGQWTYSAPCFHSGCVGSATVTLENPAPAGGLLLSLHSDNSQLTLPSSATIPAGQLAGIVPLTWGRIHTPGQAYVTGEIGTGLQAGPDLNVFLDLKTGGRVASVTASPASVVSGSDVNFTVTLESPAPSQGPVVVSYTWGSATGTVDVSAGTQTKAVALKAPYVKTDTTASGVFKSTTSATAPTGIVSASVAVVPVNIDLLGFQSSQVTGGESVMGVVSLNGAAPKEGMTIALQSNAPSLAATPTSVIVAGGARFAQFPVTTTRTATSATVNITATAPTGKAVTSQLVVNPSSPTMTQEVQK